MKKLKKNKMVARYLLIEFDIINLLFSISLHKGNFRTVHTVVLLELI